MTVLARQTLLPRYVSPAEVAAFLGGSTKTVRRLIDDQAVPGYRVGRRVLVSFRKADSFGRRVPTMATVTRPDTPQPFVPIVSDDERARRNQAARELLDSWVADGDEEEQRETMDVLRDALGDKRTLSARPIFPCGLSCSIPDLSDW